MAIHPVDPLIQSEDLVAAVDLGSNSFRMLVAQAVNTPSGTQLRPIDTLRESVRLAAGLTENKLLGNDAYQRGLTAIRRFGERIRGFDPSNVRAVATNTLRVAKNAQQFVEDAQEALGFPIEVIAGVEEARLIYIGAAHEVQAVQGNRLVVDIGGGGSNSSKPVKCTSCSGVITGPMYVCSNEECSEEGMYFHESCTVEREGVRICVDCKQREDRDAQEAETQLEDEQ